MPKPTIPIGGLLIDEGYVTPNQLSQALAHQDKHGGKIVEALIALEMLTETQLTDFFEKQPAVPSINLSLFTILPHVLSLIPKDFARKNDVFPIDLNEEHLTLGMAFPMDVATMEAVEALTGHTVKSVHCSRDNIQSAIDVHYAKSTEDAV